MNRWLVPAAVATTAVVATTRRCRRDLSRARARLSQVPRAAVETSFSVVEYADVGEGEPVLVIHGIFGGRDQGLECFDDLLPDRRVLAPSRFGYLSSSLPPDATPALQADALAELLDSLGIDQIEVFGYSAGSASALQLALRHAARVRALVVMCGDWPGPTAVAPPRLVKVAYRSDAIMWLATTILGPRLLRFVAGVPSSLPLTTFDRAKANRMIDVMFPVRERSEGILFDAYVGNPDVNEYPLEDIAVSTLIVHAQDDTMASYDAAAAAAARIPEARLVALPRGGHLMLGQQATTRAEVVQFLGEARTTHLDLQTSA